MRLLKTGPYEPGTYTLELVEIFGSRLPQYAILSHTWCNDPEDEILFSDVQNHRISFSIVINADGTESVDFTFNSPNSSEKAYGISKCQNAFKQARNEGHHYLWIDTCCIDKSSSAELSESINSMFRWYREAAICYAFLADVHLEEFADEFPKARWFSRGWCLQELIAPRTLEFYGPSNYHSHGHKWLPLGDKTSLKEHVASITAIDPEILAGLVSLATCSIAKRMSWASCRQTTRDEDMAYCLMGLFDVNMPMLYGEGGRKAFLRLQEAIMRDSDDHSIFAWSQPLMKPSETHGLLADHPSDFRLSGDIRPYSDFSAREPYSVTNLGLNVQLPISFSPGIDAHVATLNCPSSEDGLSGFVGIYLKALPQGRNQYVRFLCHRLARLEHRELEQIEKIYVRQAVAPSNLAVVRYQFFLLRNLRTSPDTTTARSQIGNGWYAYRYIISPEEPLQKYLYPLPTSASTVWTKQVRLRAGVFAALTGKSRLTVGIHIRHVLKGVVQAQFILLMGCIDGTQFGFDLCDVPPAKDFDELQTVFKPKPAGTSMELESVQVRVTTEEWATLNRTSTLVDMDVHLKRPLLMQKPTLADRIRGKSTSNMKPSTNLSTDTIDFNN